jgi:calcineurin-like phosphoesterase family protein
MVEWLQATKEYMSKNTWLTTDLHFSHKGMIELCGRPQDFEKRIVRHWDRLVKPSDTVVCMGDICIGDDKDVHQKYIEKLPGLKILVKGNHDKKSDTWYESNGWQIVCNVLLIERYGYKIALSHKPLGESDLYDINIHGHQHTTHPKGYTPDGKRFLLSLEHEKYEPVLFQSFIQRCEKIAHERTSIIAKQSLVG